MSSINRITLPNGDTYDLIDYEINPYIHHSASNKQLWLNADEYPYGSYISIFTGSASADTASAQIYLKSGNDTFQGTSLYTDYSITTANKLTTKLSGDNIILNGDTTANNNLSTIGTINCGDQLYLKDWNGVVNNNLSAIAAYAGTGATSANIYYVSNGYHAFYTGNTRYKDDNDNTVDHGHADPTETPFYIFNDRIRVNVPMTFNQGHGTNAASNTFVISTKTSSAVNLAAQASGSNGYSDITITDTKQGYYPIGITGWICSNRHASVANLRFSQNSNSPYEFDGYGRQYTSNTGTAVVKAGLTNIKTTATNNVTLTVHILWVKCSS